jgi:cobalamin-dependent methionine synthase I
MGLQPTKRYAPGYGDWELSSQTALLSLVDAGRIGIRLTGDFLMIPAKSISGVIGGR